jgi:hypothetical protein
MTNASGSIALREIDPLLQRWALPYWTWAQIRKLRAGQELTLVDFVAPGLFPSIDGAVTVVVRRIRGAFRLEAAWTAHLGKNAQRRGHLWVWADFRMLPDRKLELVPSISESGADASPRMLRLVDMVMRRAVALSNWAKRDNDIDAFSALAPSGFMSRQFQTDEALRWLENLRGPELRIAA